MSDWVGSSDIIRHITRWDKRRRTVLSVASGLWGMAAGMSAGLLAAIISRITPWLPVNWIVGVTLLAGLAGVIVALALVWLKPQTLLDKARFFDRQFGLKERISTAVEIGGDGGFSRLPEWMAQEQVQDALAAAGKVKAEAFLPFRLEVRHWAPVLLVAALTAGAIWAPNPMQDILAERLAVRQSIEEQVESIEAIREEIEADPELSETDRQEMEDILEGAVEKLQEKNLTREEALAEINNAEERLREIGDAAEKSAEGLVQAGQAMQDSTIAGDLAQALMDQDFDTAAEILEDLSNEMGDELSRDEELELAQQLSEASGALAESNPELSEQLAQAADAINQGDIASAREKLGQASRTTGQAGEQMAAGKAAENAAGRMSSGGQQVAQAGKTGSGKSEGSGSQGTAGQGGQGQSGTGQSGSGMSQGGAGRGESNGAAAGGTAGQMNPNNGPGDGGLRTFEQIYAPQRIGGQGGPEMELDSSDDPGELVRELGSNPEIGQSTVPYNQVYASYADAASQALQEQRIPLGLRGYVRDYFSSLEP